MHKMKRLKQCSLLFFFACLAVPLLAQTPLPKGIIKITPRPAPALVLENMEGQQVELIADGRRWHFVHFWASWCGPCRREIPAIEKLVTSFANSTLAFYIVNTAESEDTVFSFLGGIAPNLDSLLDRDGQVTEQWQPRGLPSTYLVDPDGQIQYIVIGGQDWQKPQYQLFLKHLLGANKKGY